MEELQELMKNTRTHYELSKIAMSRICGFGDNQWMLYENGRTEPNKSNLKLIKRCCTPTGFHTLLMIADPKEIHMYDRAKEISKQTMSDVKSIVQVYQNSIEEKYFD